MSLKRAPLFVLPLFAAASAASAADISPVVVPPVVVPPPTPQLTLVQVEGGPIFSPAGILDVVTSQSTVDEEDKFGVIPNDRGFYLGGAVRRMFTPNLSVQGAVTGTWLRTLELEAVEDPLLLESALRFQTFDLDVGFHRSGDIRNRVFAGLRVLHSTDSLLAYTPGPENQSTGTAWLFGPRAGVNADIGLGASNFSFVAELSAAALFGHATVFITVPDENIDRSGSRMVFNAEGLLGLSWHPSESAALTMGYRAQQWWGLRQATEVSAGSSTFFVDPDKLLHGPFARFSLIF